MKKSKQLILTMTFLLFIVTVFAQSNCDPWITAIYRQLYNRQPTTTECNISNYNNGSWSSYQQLTDYIKKYQSSKSGQSLSSEMVSGDPWIMDIYQKIYGRKPNSWELNIRNYNNGSWNSYQQLSGYIQQFQKALKDNGIEIETALLDDKYNLVAMKKDNQYIAANILENKGGNVIAAGGGNVIAAGGGNVIAAGGGNVIAAGGGNVIAAGGGNVIAAGGGNLGYRISSAGNARFMVSSSLLGAGFSSGYSVQSGAKMQIRTAGSTSIIFK